MISHCRMIVPVSCFVFKMVCVKVLGQSSRTQFSYRLRLARKDEALLIVEHIAGDNQ